MQTIEFILSDGTRKVGDVLLSLDGLLGRLITSQLTPFADHKHKQNLTHNRAKQTRLVI